MKNQSLRLFATLVFTLAAFGYAHAQNNDIKVPLSNPGKSGHLKIDVVHAEDIEVEAYDGQEVIVKFDSDDDDRDRLNRRNGLRRISTNGVGLEITEDNNKVDIRADVNSHDLELKVMVPRNFSVKINAVHGDVTVLAVEGEVEIESVNGDVEMNGLLGAALVNSVNGDIEVRFSKVKAGTPMSFTGVNGDIEISFPENTKFSARMKTEWGDIYTNFDMDINQQPNKTEVSKNKGKYKVSVNKWVYGDVNGGGPEFLFKTLHGDISIRKN